MTYREKIKEAEEQQFALRKFVLPEFVFGPGARKLAGRYARNFGARKALIVTDPGVMKAGWTEDVTVSLEAAELSYTIYSHVTPNPRSEEVKLGAQVYQREGCNILIAVGGGSPIDCAKGIGIVTSNHKDILDFVGVDQVPVPMPPLICIPTTGGSSADLSQFAIINNEKEKIKVAIISKAVVPDLALIDPITLLSMPPYLTACTSFDALTHAIEAYVSIAHSPITDLHALEAVRLISSNLEASLGNPEDIELRTQMMLGSVQAGIAFSNASLGATHAMAHSLGGLLDVAHGECNAILLEHVVAFNFDEVPMRYERVGEAMGLDLKGKSIEGKKSAILCEIRRLRISVGIERTLRQLGMQQSDIPQLAQKAMKDTCMVTNPRRPTQKDIEAIYGAAF
ncbi:alcohol dehydrogenase-like regulatory protein ErcA [Desulforhabdus amnigena]|jgi:alcohol dehydrogenase class IV|uniref:Iron-containing alcohol dehydrogenase n=1 Tax=Desulforhabdus amnigena TaxID=40218 RepID=A0A9W6D0D4_9BACT|nr:alcohol dehydrogenase-like regulatory protein ErcA [Desulforhabdus amnigena]NLJ27740.1 iron-containing alcohol dehydrogenase [Deltaproteobacteria bacterium]GLI32968.1 iron-containing alcohol dehydrogenase [Desulforhabdus amnigena]